MRETLINLGLSVALMGITIMGLLLLGVEAKTILSWFVVVSLASGVVCVITLVMEFVDTMRAWLNILR
jgi:hypothetical protein